MNFDYGVASLIFLASVSIPVYIMLLLFNIFVRGVRIKDYLRNVGWIAYSVMVPFQASIGCTGWSIYVVAGMYGIIFYLLQYVLDKQKVIDFKREKDKRG